MSLTVEEAYTITLEKRGYLKSKALKKIQHELGRNKYVSDEELEDLVSDTVTATIIRLSEEKAVFEKESELLSYIIQANWWNYRDTYVRNTKRKELTRDEIEVNRWIGENSQPDIFTDAGKRIKNLPPINPKYKAEFINIYSLPELPAYEPYEYSAQHQSDTYYAELCEKVFIHLEECVMNKVFSFRDVGLFKMFLVNGYTSATQLAENTDFTIDVCRKAISKIKKHLKESNLNK